MKRKKREAHEVLIHDLKSDPQSFIAVMRNEKLAEIRVEDRGYEEGDYILLKETLYTGEQMNKYDKAIFSRQDVINKPLIYTGRHHMLKITHVHKDIGLEKGYVALSFIKLD